MLTINNLSIWFRSRGMERLVVSDFSLSIAAGEVLGLVGESGSGKSVTALAILRLLDAAARVEGSISFDGVDFLALSNEEMRKRRGRDIAMIFQEPMTALNPVMTIGEQVAEAIRTHQLRLSRKQVRQTVVEGARSGSDSRAGQPLWALSAPVLRRPAAAHSHRHGDRKPAEAADRRRADHRARCYRAGADTGAARRSPPAFWPGDAVYLSRPGGRLAGRRPGDGDAAWKVARKRLR